MSEIKNIRKQLGLTQSQFCKKFGNIPLRSYQRWESGRYMPQYVLNIIKIIIELEGVKIG